MDNLSGNIVVLIDPQTRKSAESITYDALSKHVTVITDLREITDTYYGCDFVFFEPSVPGVVTLDALRETIDLYSVNAHLVYSIDEIGVLLSEVCQCVKASYRTIEWNLIYAVVHSDLAVLEPYQRTIFEPVEFAKTVESLPSECVDPVSRMYHSYISLARSYNTLISENARSREMLSMYRCIGAKTQQAIEELQGLLIQ